MQIAVMMIRISTSTITHTITRNEAVFQSNAARKIAIMNRITEPKINSQILVH